MSEQQTTALAVREESQMGPAAYVPRSFDEIVTVCERLVKSGFLGPHIKDTNQAVAIVMTGMELGFPFMASFRKVYVFQGRIGVMTALLVAKVKASQVCEYFRTVEMNEQTCTVETKRRGSPAPESYTFTHQMAVECGYAEKNPKYKNKGERPRMLYARAAGYLCNDVYADLTMGMEPAETMADYEPEEMKPAAVRPLAQTSPPQVSVVTQPTVAPTTPAKVVEAIPEETDDAAMLRFEKALRTATSFQAIKPTIAEIKKRWPDEKNVRRRTLAGVLKQRQDANWAAEKPPEPAKVEPTPSAVTEQIVEAVSEPAQRQREPGDDDMDDENMGG